MKQTAVEWLIEQMKTYNMTVSVHNTSHQNVMDFYKAIEQAKEMEKEQIINARINGDMNGMCIAKLAKEKAEKYYNETFKSE
jgi:sulfatase maturation enzyme AslB (radical SAM superfamily)